ncbi:MAG: glycosyltransferase family 9 protein [Magnetospirillum sp.]|nr:glycosyltransferase family 9 protein [Magnetospirillum sp.]
MTASVLIHVGLDLVGDGLMKLPFIRALRAAFPDARITWLAGQGQSAFAGTLAPLVAGLLDEVVAEDPAAFARRCRAAGQRFDVVLDTQRGFLTALRLRRIPHRRFISPALAFLLSSERPRAYRKPPLLAAQLMDLASLTAGAPVQPQGGFTIPAAAAAEATALLPAGPHYVGLAPGAGSRHKCWPLEHFIRLGGQLAQEGKAPVFILGPAEQDWADTVRAALPEALLPLQAARTADVVLTLAVGARLASAVANDAGVGHLLAAAGTPLVSLFGPTPPAKFAPWATRARIVRAQDFGSDSMDAIPIEAVQAALAALDGDGADS